MNTVVLPCMVFVCLLVITCGSE
uniref:Uncharacterized protein n=1 Tax=Anopheles minimus TaxID=112268 RepID=A0A182WPB0_9DIPT